MIEGWINSIFFIATDELHFTACSGIYLLSTIKHQSLFVYAITKVIITNTISFCKQLSSFTDTNFAIYHQSQNHGQHQEVMLHLHSSILKQMKIIAFQCIVKIKITPKRWKTTNIINMHNNRLMVLAIHYPPYPPYNPKYTS